MPAAWVWACPPLSPAPVASASPHPVSSAAPRCGLPPGTKALSITLRRATGFRVPASTLKPVSAAGLPLQRRARISLTRSAVALSPPPPPQPSCWDLPPDPGSRAPSSPPSVAAEFWSHPAPSPVLPGEPNILRLLCHLLLPLSSF